MKVTGTLALKVTVEVRVGPVFVTVAVVVLELRVKRELLAPVMLPLKIFVAAVSAAVTSPLPVMVDAASQPGEFCEIDATAAASAADCSLAFMRVASE